MIKRVILWRADQAGCGHARIDMIAKYLNAYHGDEIEAISSQVMDPNEWATTDSKGQVIKKNFDLTIHQRQYGKANLQNFRFLKNNLRIPSIYEIDDYLHGVSKWSAAYYAYNPEKNPERFENINSYLKESSAVTVTTDYLRKLYSCYNSKIYVLPNSLDFEEVYTKEVLDSRLFRSIEHKSNNKVYIGWAGSNTHLADLKIVVDAVKQILRDFPQTILCLGGWDGAMRDKEGKVVYPHLNPWNEVPEDRKICVPWAKDMKDYPNMLTHFDIGLAPLEDIDFNRAKSNIKFLEYSACKVPTIASAVEPYSKTIEVGETGLLCKTKGAVFMDWYKSIKRLVLDEQLREKLSENAYNYVYENFNIKKNIKLWKNLYIDIIDGREV
jgi:glycosyltransferase involved in cell wall biosynthesis